MSKNKIQIICAVTGLIGGMLGILGGGLNLWEKFIPSSDVEVLEVIPIAVKDNSDLLMDYGVSAIVHLKNKSRDVLISGLDLSGRYYHPQVTAMMDTAFGRLEMKNMRVSFSAWPKDSSIAVRLQPFEEKWVAFTFIEPHTVIKEKRIETKWVNQDYTKTMFSDYPESIARYVFVHDSGKLIDLNPNITESYYLKFQLRVGVTILTIPETKIKRYLIISKVEWDSKTAQELFSLSGSMLPVDKTLQEMYQKNNGFP